MKKNVPYNKIDIVRDLKEMVTHNSKKFGEKAAFEYAGKDGKISKSFIHVRVNYSGGSISGDVTILNISIRPLTN